MRELLIAIGVVSTIFSALYLTFGSTLVPAFHTLIGALK